ncbi:MAG: DUF4388 domain-containing protein [Acidimicrobiia bacterium]
MHLSGQLTDWSINDLLQIMQVTKKTGSLDIEGDRRGRIHFHDGAVTGAELIGDEGSLIGDDRGGIADILFVLSTLDSGSFSVGAADGPDTSGWGVEEVLADVDALKSLEGVLVAAGLFESNGVRLVADIDESITVNSDDWMVLVSLVPAFTFDDLEAKVGRGGAVRVLHTLHRMGVAAATGDVDESDWLDRVADDVAPTSDDPIWLEEVSEEPDISTQTQEGETPASEDDSAEESSEDTLVGLSDDSPAEDASNEGASTDVPGVSAPASTTLTDGVYDEIRRLRSKVVEK